MVNEKNIQGSARIKTVKLSELRVSAASQRELRKSWATELAETFDLDMVGTFTTSYRDGIYWIVDGQHRFYALTVWAKREFGEDWGDWTLQVWAHEGLAEGDEAKLFLAFNNRRAVNTFDKFKVGITAGLPVPTDIDRVVRALDLRVEKGRRPGAISAVGAMERVYRDGGAVLLRKTLEAVRDAWNGSGFDSEPVQGVGKFIARYEGRVDVERLVKVLGKLHNGARGLRQLASVSRETYGGDLVTNMAAVITDLYNKGQRGTNSLGSWWKVSAVEAVGA